MNADRAATFRVTRNVGEGTKNQLRAPTREHREQSRKSNVPLTRQAHAGKAEHSPQAGKVKTRLLSRHAQGRQARQRDVPVTPAAGHPSGPRAAERGGGTTRTGADVRAEPWAPAGGRRTADGSRCGKRSGSVDDAMVGRVTSPRDGRVLPLGLEPRCLPQQNWDFAHGTK